MTIKHTLNLHVFSIDLNKEVRRKRQYILFFALLQLMVFIAPMAIKLIHHHETERVVFSHTTNKTLAKDKEQCPICHFEFVNFIPGNRENISTCFQDIAVLLNSGPISPLLNSPLQFFSNRAPPFVAA
jgi:hypothetical protein